MIPSKASLKAESPGSEKLVLCFHTLYLVRGCVEKGIPSANVIAKAIGVSLSSVNHWENGRYLPTITPIQTCTYAFLLRVLPQDIAAVQEVLIHEGGIPNKKNRNCVPTNRYTINHDGASLALHQ